MVHTTPRLRGSRLTENAFLFGSNRTSVFGVTPDSLAQQDQAALRDRSDGEPVSGCAHLLNSVRSALVIASSPAGVRGLRALPSRCGLSNRI
jgi:hypothetical protein